MGRENIIDTERLRREISYSPETGELHWLVTQGSRAAAGAKITSKHESGYCIVRFQKIPLRAHRVAWALHYGQWPDGEIDHINRIKDDNRLCNLRVVSPGENRQNQSIRRNSKSGYRGVCWAANIGKWAARIGLENRSYGLGFYETPQAAYAAYVNAARKLHTHNWVTSGDLA